MIRTRETVNIFSSTEYLLLNVLFQKFLTKLCQPIVRHTVALLHQRSCAILLRQDYYSSGQHVRGVVAEPRLPHSRSEGRTGACGTSRPNFLKELNGSRH
jgi:hypothetical protein